VKKNPRLLTLSILSAGCPVVFVRMSTRTCFCALTSFHLIWSSVACLSPVLGTLGWCNMAVACGVMKRLPLFPADKIMHAWPIATPVPTVYIYITSQRCVARVVERTRTSLPIYSWYRRWPWPPYQNQQLHRQHEYNQTS